MANRVVNGNTNTENGWPLVDQGSCTWIGVPGTNPPVNLQIQNGQPLALLRAWAADVNAFVQPLRDGDSACWTDGNSVLGTPGRNNGSNHMSGSAEDLDWNDHPMGNANAGWNSDQVATIREMLAFYTLNGVQMVWWGNDWDTPKDSMHFQVGYDTYGNPVTQDFIARFIRADGYSTFRRGNAPMADDAAHILSQATGLDLSRATEILPTVTSGLKASDCTNVNRIAMWLAQCGEESAGFSTTEEFASGAEYEGRTDLGNTQLGDGVRFKGRTWIQITGRDHYTQFSLWAFNQGLCTSPTQFADDPTSLGDLQWAGIGAAWYWTVERPQINGLCDSGDLLAVTKAINGGTNGLADRQSRYDLAHALGDQLLELISGDDDLSAADSAKIDAIYQELTKKFPSRSALRHLDQTKFYPGGLVDTLAGMVLNVDANEHVQMVMALAAYHHPATIDLLTELATADPALYPDRADDIDLANAILAKVADAQVTSQVAAAVAPLAPNAQAATQVIQYVPVQAPVAPVAAPVATAGVKTTGQKLDDAYSALDALLDTDELTAAQKVIFGSFIGVIQTKIQGVPA